jgi:uncharacterized protein with PIN domain
MAQTGLSVQLSIKEIYDKLCPKCKEKLRQLVKEKVTDDMVNKIIGE